MASLKSLPQVGEIVKLMLMNELLLSIRSGVCSFLRVGIGTLEPLLVFQEHSAGLSKFISCNYLLFNAGGTTPYIDYYII